MRIRDWSSAVCSSELSAADPTMETAPASLDAESAPTDASPSVPDHNYDEKRGWTYYYVAAVSDEDRKKGRAAGSVVAYQYPGKNEAGQPVLAYMNNNGTVNNTASCENGRAESRESDGAS